MHIDTLLKVKLIDVML